ncbi:MAG: BTAD domain-containing putative transcriptional regulator [Acidimicrobiia bacterium]
MTSRGDLSLEFRLLGPFQVAAGGRVVEIGSAKQRGVLALLAVHLNRPVASEKLIEELWRGNPPASVQSTVQSLVYRIRRALGDAGAEAAGVALRGRGSAYVLEADELQVDARRFEVLVGRGRELLAAEAADGAARALTDALGLWRGPALDDLAEMESIRVEATRLEEARLSAVEALADAELARDRPEAAVGLLEPHVGRYPLREGAWAQLMVALYRLGRQAEALRAYQELRRVLGEELGLEPNPALRQLEQQILLQSPELAGPQAAAAASVTTMPPIVPVTEVAEGALSTIVFTDVEGSTALRTSRGDDAAQGILRKHEHLVRKLLAEHSGREVKALGDGFLALFGSARRALAFAVALQRSLEEERWSSPAEAVRVRIGISAGEVVEEGGDVFGQAVHAAARVAGKAEGGQILVSEVVRRLVGSAPDTEFRDVGRFRLKGFPERWRLFELVWADTHPSAAAPSPTGRAPLVGRRGQLSELQATLERALSGAGSFVTVCGEAGIGKSRLTEELIAEALQRRTLVFVGRCAEAEGAASYAPLTEILDAALAQAPSPEAFRNALGDDAPEIARLMPRLRRLFPDIGPALELPPDQERRYLFNSIVDFLARTARARPTVLVFEDLHWADEATLLMIEHLASHLGDLPALVVATYRDVELDDRPLLARAVESLVRRRLVHQVRLGRLEEKDVGQMLGALARQEAPAPVVDVVFSETEGNPFLVEEMFKYLVDEGRLLDADGRFRLDVEVQELDVPENVRLVVGRRLDRLSDDARRVLGTAAVIGRYFRYEVLEAAAGLAGDNVLDAVDEAERAHLIVAAPGDASGERFGFGHELVRQTVLTRISAPRRRRLHLAVADAMEATLGRALEDHASDLAHHLVEAGAAAVPSRTFRYLVLAGRRALAVSAFEDALRFFEQAAALEVPEPTEQAELLVDLSRAQRSVGRWDVALATSLEAISAYESLGDALAVGRVSADAAYGLAWLARFGDAYDVARRGLTATAGLATPERGYLLAVLGMVSAYTRTYEEGQEAIDAAAALADRLDDGRLAAYVADQRGHLEWGWMRHREAVEAGWAASDGLQAVGDLWERAIVLGFVLFSLVQLGRFDEADAVGAELEPLAERLGCYPALLFCNRARLLTGWCRTADLIGLEAAAARDFEINQAIGGAWSGQAHTWQGLVHFWRGDWPPAGRHFEEGARLDPDGALNGWGWAWLFQYRAYTGAKDEALGMLAEREDDLPRAGGPNRFGPWTMLGTVVEGLVVLGEHDRAAAHYPVLVEALADGVVGGNYHDVRLFQRVAGIAAAAGGRFDDAEGHFTAALQLAEKLPHRIEQLETRRFYAQMLLDRDGARDQRQAVKLLTEASAGYKQLGMPKHAELVEATFPQSGGTS